MPFVHPDEGDRPGVVSHRDSGTLLRTERAGVRMFFSFVMLCLTFFAASS